MIGRRPCGFYELRLALFAFFHAVRTAIVKITARTLRVGRRHVAFQYDTLALPLDFRIGDRNGGKQRFRIRMERIRVEVFIAARLDDFSEIHDGNPVGNVFDDRQIVRDKQIRQFHFFLNVFKKIQHLRLDRNVEGGNGFVGEYEARLQRKRACDTDPLPLTA